MLIRRHVVAPLAGGGPGIVVFSDFAAIHRGDQGLLRHAVERARAGGGHTVALLPVTSHHHPSSRPRLTSLSHRVRLVGQTGCDAVVLYRVADDDRSTALAALRDDTIWRALRPRVLVIERHDEASHEHDLLLQLCSRHGIELDEEAPLQDANRVVTTGMVRDAISRGDLDQVRRLLGRPHHVSGRVRVGHRRGRTLGFPTANLRIQGMALPPNGVYAVRVRAAGITYDGVANLGTNPTFGEHEQTLEPHLFGFDGDLYGQRLEVEFVAWIRSERRFANVDELRAQIACDAETARARLQCT